MTDIQMSDSLIRLLDPSRILFDLQQGNEIAQSFSGCLEPEKIARQVTDGLVEQFDCAFARLWLLEPDQTALKLVASSGMYTHTDGSFARVPMGAYKVGKIAQNRVSFLSNNLSQEPWVGNREWAISNNIHGFAGYPLAIKDRVIGVLATFSHSGMEPEFLEVLQTVCTIATISLDTALQYQKEKQSWQSSTRSPTFNHLSLSDQLVTILNSTRLTLVGTEQPLTLPLIYVFLQTAIILNKIGCNYCRLIYTDISIGLEAIVPIVNSTNHEQKDWIESLLGELCFTVSCLGGVLQNQASTNQRSIQVFLKIPYYYEKSSEQLRIECRLPLLQLALTQLAFSAGLRVYNGADEEVLLLTDDLTRIQSAKRVIWIQHGAQVIPKGIKGKVDLSISSDELRQAVKAVISGKVWGIEPNTQVQILSEREVEILALLAQGLRDRDIANRLIISESTVKFHMNNVLGKLKARTRYQALHQAIVQGWI